MHYQCQLVEINLVLEQRVGVSRHLYLEFVLEVLCNFRVLQSVLIGDCFKLRQLLLMMRVEVALILLQEFLSFRVKILEDHIEVEADENGEKNPHKLRFELV